MDMLNIKPLSEDREWSQQAGLGSPTTGAAEEQGSAMASTSSEERALRRVVGRWGPEWLS
ncbi:hypothetical protein JYU34_001462 [Plutella xylostella]|uniref:Uncharacterized protein n=1 Tax=Plutella xylostella TaxID=51655 RepID=A0ABQ7R3Z7_PLUXY|nr:hypothetical protein JYU34_001462 [Plutella xylostella]